MLISYLLRETWLARFPIHLYGLYVVYGLIVYSSIFSLGIVHSRIHDALYHRDPAQQKITHWKRTFQFFCLQVMATSPFALGNWAAFSIIV